MPRKKLIRTDSYPYHITSRSNNKEWFYIPTQEVWKICCSLIQEGQKKFNTKIDAFVLMNNHYHMLIYTPNANIDKFMQFFNKNLGQTISRKAKRINRIFGASYKWNIIESQSYYKNVLRYIYQNPLRANIVQKINDYPFTDFKTQKHHHNLEDWINIRLKEKDEHVTRKILRRKIITNSF
ncbi:MAG: transposase [Bacteriovoracaceae bacterium]|jgi:putative transposase|nr:transposase [Bacteriovoracaceae bacterium]